MQVHSSSLIYTVEFTCILHVAQYTSLLHVHVLDTGVNNPNGCPRHLQGRLRSVEDALEENSASVVSVSVQHAQS